MSVIQEKHTSKNQKNKPGLRLFAVIAVLILVNIGAWFFYGQVDLTGDKRYTITPSTHKMLQNLKGKTEVLLFLDGEDLPAAFQSLSRSTQTMLRHFRDISNNKVVFRVMDPLGKDTTAINILRQYRMSGIPVSVNAGKKGTIQKTIFPWALVTKVDEEGRSLAYPVFLQEVNTLNLNRETLLKSEMLLEYNLANGIHQLAKSERPAIAYLTGNGEVYDFTVYDAISTLRKAYRLDTFNLQQHSSIPGTYKAIIINRPVLAFDENDKYKIDQYLMNGGNILWSINMVTGTLDSMRSIRFNAMPLDLNLNDLLFNYGVRINTNLIEDAVNSAFVPLQAAGNRAQPDMRPWIYFPVLVPGSGHPIVKNLSGVLTRFVSSIDTNSNDIAITKTVLLSSSKYSKTESAPLPIMLETAIDLPNPAAFPQKNLVGAILLEGNFTSAFATRQPVEVRKMLDSLGGPLVERAKQPGKMIVMSDADMLVNEFSEKKGPSEMGIFLFTPEHIYDNKSFLLNCLEYMTDSENLLEARSKTFDSRRLDPKLIENEQTTWQLINIGGPVVAILLLGTIFFFLRKRKYAA